MKVPRRVRNPKRLPPPRYSAKRPQLRAFREFNVVSGSQDTIINLIEVALRFFEREMESQDNPTQFVNDTIREFSVNSSLGVNWTEVRRNAHYYSVMQAISVLDDFLAQLSYEFRFYHGTLANPWINSSHGNNLDPLAALLENVATSEKNKARSCPEYDLIQYYRAVRNRFVHRTDKDSNAKLAKLLEKNKDHFEKCYSMLPKEYEKIDYDDFMLLTVSAKNFSKVLNDACGLSGAILAQSFLQDVNFLRRIRLKRNMPERLDGVIHSVTSEFAMSEKDETDFRSSVLAFLAKDPTRKQRDRK